MLGLAQRYIEVSNNLRRQYFWDCKFRMNQINLIILMISDLT